MKSVVEQPSKITTKTYSKKIQTLIILAVALIACTSYFDRLAHNMINESLTSAVITFGTASVLDSSLSVLKSTEFSVGVASLDIGEMLNSVSDIIDQFKHVMALALASLSLQKFLLITMSSALFNALIIISGASLLTSLWIAKVSPLRTKLTAIFKTLLVLRFSILLSVGLTIVADFMFISDQVESSEHEVTAISANISGNTTNFSLYSTEKEESAEDSSFMEGVSNSWNKVKSSVSTPKQIITNTLDSLDDAMVNFINLMVLFVLKTIFLPILFLLAVKNAIFRGL